MVNGAVALVIALDAPNKKAAEGIAIGKLYEKYPESVDNFSGRKPWKIRPGTLARLWASSMKSLPPRTLSTATHGPQRARAGSASRPGRFDGAACRYSDRRRRHVLQHRIDNHQLSMAADFINDEETPDDTGMRDLITGLQSVKAVGAMSPEAILRLAQAVIQNFGDDMPSHDDVVEFAQGWVNNPRDRENLTQTSTSTGNASGAADYNTLSMHTALSIMGVNPAEAKAADVKNAKEIIANRDNAWRAWDKTLRVIVGILNVETDVRHGIISDGLKTSS